MHRFRTLLTLALAVGSGRGAAAQAPFPADSELARMLEARVARAQAVGLVVGLLDSDGHRTIVAAGDPGPGRPPLDGATVFEIGSITKTFTATLLAVMAQDGEVSLSEPVARLLPPGARVPATGSREITLVDLATHTSGLPSLPGNFAPADPGNPYADYTMEQLVDFLAGYVLPRPPGLGFQYSNLGFGLLGIALANRAGQSFGEVVAGRILDPLEMRSSGITLPGDARARLAEGHDAWGQPVPNWVIPTLAGAGALLSTVSDMLDYAAAGLPGAEGQLAAAMREAEQPRRAIATGDSIGLAWITTHTPRVVITWHNGGTGGFRGFLGLDRKARRAVVILANSANSVDDLGFHLLDPGSPLSKPQVAGPVLRAWFAGGLTPALARYDSLKATEPDRYDFSEPELNTVGYVMLGRGRVEDAIAVFQRNVDLFPGGSNTYDSLGEAYLAHGDTALAITNYRRSVELNPLNQNGRAVLARLGVEP
jgi:D-alanyl-D-alanine-carboxypeptidase/D-alanyl-D-alanine-endopeptidase